LSSFLLTCHSERSERAPGQLAGWGGKNPRIAFAFALALAFARFAFALAFVVAVAVAAQLRTDN
jgi:hypothetical protein